MKGAPKVVFVNPCRVSAGKAFVLPAAPVTLAGAIPARIQVDPAVVDEAITRFDRSMVRDHDIVCISVLTNNCREAYRIAAQAKQSNATVIMGGPHVTLLPDEALKHGADAVVRGDGDVVLGQVLEDALMNRIVPGRIYQTPNGQPFRVNGDEMAYPRLDLVDLKNYMTTSLRSTAGCRENCTFCTVPSISGRVPRYRPVEAVAREISELYDRNIRFVIWGADNLVQVPLSIVKAGRTPAEAKTLEAEREEALTFFRELGKRTSKKRVWGFAQLTLRLFDDPEMLRAIRHDAAISAALFGIESVDPAALRRMAKQWNGTRDEITMKVRMIQKAGIHVLGSMIVGLPTDTPETIAAMRQWSVESGMRVAQFPIYEILPGSPDHQKAERDLLQRNQPANQLPIVTGNNGHHVKLLRRNWWLEPEGSPPHLEHPCLSRDQLLDEDRRSWNYFYRSFNLLRNSMRNGWPLRGIAAYVAACKSFALFYGGSVGISVDSARKDTTSAFRRLLMSASVWLMHKVPPPLPATAENFGTHTANN